MTFRDFQFDILAEDREQQEFLYQWLMVRGASSRKVRKIPLPAGKGAGEQYVRLHYPKWATEQRRRAHHQNVCLMVSVDADTLTVSARLADVTAGDVRDPAERIVVLIPKRNVETWFHFLDGHVVDERTDYKAAYAQVDKPWKSAARALESWLQEEPIRPGSPPSLAVARNELKRLPV